MCLLNGIFYYYYYYLFYFVVLGYNKVNISPFSILGSQWYNANCAGNAKLKGC